jgi:hypothetical protein
MEGRELAVYRGCTPVVDATYEPEDGSTSVVETIALAIADAAGVDPTTLPPLYDYVDPDALNAMFDRREGLTDDTALLSFQMETWNVFVSTDGRIRVCDATRPTDPELVFESSTA